MAVTSMIEDFINISLFGSAARGDSDSLSDLDIIAVVRDGGGKISSSSIDDWVSRSFPEMRASISWYGERKIREFFRSGDLFAWHLHLESQPIMGFSAISEIYGVPQPYGDALFVIEELIEVIADVAVNLQRFPQNAIFEAGVLYVCLRNIGMAASWDLSTAPNFTRCAPFFLEKLDFPFSDAQYRRISSCRMAGQRGIEAPEVSVEELGYWLDVAALWATKVRKMV